MSTVVTDYEGPQMESIPLAISRLIEGAVAAFDADRSIARSYLLEASALLNVRDEVRGDQCLRLNTAGAGGLALWQLKRVVDYIEKNLTDKIAGEDLATVINVSLGQLFRGFKTSVGLTPFQYITKRRIDFACDLMKTTAEPLSQIALSCGLCDQSHFCRVFRREMGTTPAHWRKANSEGPSLVSRGAAREPSRVVLIP